MSRSSRCRACSTRTRASTTVTSSCVPAARRHSASASSVLERGRVRAAGGHHVPRVGDRDDARAERDRVAGQAVRIAGAVDALVVRAHPGDLVARQHLGRDLGAERGVQLHVRVLRRRQPARLQQRRVGHAHLADVVDERRELQPLDLRRRPAELGRQRAGHRGDAVGVADGRRDPCGRSPAPARGCRPATGSAAGSRRRPRPRSAPSSARCGCRRRRAPAAATRARGAAGRRARAPARGRRRRRRSRRPGRRRGAGARRRRSRPCRPPRAPAAPSSRLRQAARAASRGAARRASGR